MHYLANYYKNLSEQLQEKVNFLEAQLKEGRFVIDPATGKGKIIPDPNMRLGRKPARPGIPMFPERKPLIGKVPMSIDPDLLRPIPKRSNDELNVMPEPDRDEINITPEFGQRGPIRPENKILKTTTAPREKIDFLDRVSEMPSSGTIPSNLKPISPGSKIYTPSELDLERLPYDGSGRPGRLKDLSRPTPDRTMSQSEVDDEGKPTGLVRVTHQKPKIKKFGDSGPKIPPAPIKPQGSQIKNNATNIDYANFKPELRQNYRG